MTSFDIFPAIDLRNGKVVRLRQGDPEQSTTYSSDPLEVARKWQAAGSKWLHVVNLDGALDEDDCANLNALQTIAQTGLKIQFGGGIRSAAAIETALKLGLTRVILGTMVLEDPDSLSGLITRFGAERIVIGLDSRDGIVRSHGWKQASDLSPQDAAEIAAAAGARTLIVTDIHRDGMGTGPNLALAAGLADANNLLVIASGGVHNLEHVRAARKLNLAGIIIGRALYDGHLQLAEVLAC